MIVSRATVSCNLQLGSSGRFTFPLVRICASIFVCFCVASASPAFAPAAGILVNVDPANGNNSLCMMTLVCETIVYAVQVVGASQVNLSSGIFNEPTVNIDNVASLVFTGVPSSTIIDCSRRLQQTTGAAFNISNSTVVFTGITFQHCSNPNNNGGAVSALDSSITVSQCRFFNCSAANGGAIAATGTGGGMFLDVQNSSFMRNAAIGGAIACPTGARSSEPCSTWGGAVAAFEMSNVSITGCTMAENSAVAVVPVYSRQNSTSKNAVAGGGCVSVSYRGNSSASILYFRGNSFAHCTVDVSGSSNIRVGNGYGGAVSVYYGFSAGLQLLSVAFLSISLRDNVFGYCIVRASAQGGNAYGGAVSLYIGAYASAYSAIGTAVAAAGDTVVRNGNITLDTARFESCSVIREWKGSYTFGANVYGGSFSFHIGAYAWSLSDSFGGNSTSMCGSTIASSMSIRIQNTTSDDSRALTTISGGSSLGANTYGGSMSVLHVGAYTWSLSNTTNSNSNSICGETAASEVSVHISGSACSNCSAISTASTHSSYSAVPSTEGANSYGGSMSVFHVGAYSWSLSNTANSKSDSNSVCGATAVSNVSVHVSGSICSDCSAMSTASGGFSDGANSYGGSMSVLHIGAYSWSWSYAANSNSNSICGETEASGVSVHVSGLICSNCSAISGTSGRPTNGANSYGGSMSVLLIGAYSWSFNDDANSNSICGATVVSEVSVCISGSVCSNCSAMSTTSDSYGANSYGGAISATFIGAYSYSSAFGTYDFSSRSIIGTTQVHHLSIAIQNATIVDAMAVSESTGNSHGANVYGGAISVIVGPYAWSFMGYGSSFGSCDRISCYDCSVQVSGTSITNSHALSNTSGSSRGAFVYGGGVAFVVQPYIWNYNSYFGESSTFAGNTTVSNLSAVFVECNFSDNRASTRTIGDSQVSASGSDAIGGAVAVVVGVCVTNSVGQSSSGSVVFGHISFEGSGVAMMQSSLISCAAESITDSSVGTSSVFGGALAIFHSSQVSNFILGVLAPSNIPHHESGFNLAVLVSKSHFVQCSVRSSAASVRPGEANGGGGAVYVSSVALTNLSVTNATFVRNSVTVTSAATGLSSFSSGGAVAVEAGISDLSLVALSSCNFVKCTVQGANISNMVVRGGAVHVLHAANITVSQTNFTNCSIIDSVIGGVVSGGASMSAVVTGNMLVTNCVFDASGGQDTSSTSTGLLVLARNSSDAHVELTGCTFFSSTVVLNVRCVGNDESQRVDSCIGPRMMLVNSRVVQVLPQFFNDFKTTGSNLVSLQNPKSISFTSSSMHCALPQFAAFKQQPVTSSHGTTTFFCKPCDMFYVSLTANTVSLDELSNARSVDRCYHVSNSPGTLDCPFAIVACTTFVSVSIGFWTNITDSGTLDVVRRCPRGYCGCTNSTKGCPLPPLISINRNRDPLCNRNRTGMLCGGCPPNFTQSLDDRTCISNDECSNSMWWVWTISILGFAAYSLYVVVSCQKLADDSVSCLLFYFQMSSFAANAEESDSSLTVFFFEFSQVRSVAAMYKDACYAPSMSAYNATSFKLIGPLCVLAFAVLWTWIIRKLQPKLQQRNIHIALSYSGSIAATILFVFSNVANVVFTLVECTSYSGSDSVVVIDGTVPCRDARWNILVFVTALLFLFPAAFAAALHMKKLPQSARDAVCGKFTAPVFYWGAVTLAFRLLVSVAQFLRDDFPNLTAFLRLLLTVGILFLLVNLRPYISERAFWIESACYVCLIAQFGLQEFGADREFVGFADSSDKQTSFLKNISTGSTAVRFVPVGVYVAAWLKTKFQKNAQEDLCQRIADLARKAKLRCAALAQKCGLRTHRREKTDLGISMNSDLI